LIAWSSVEFCPVWVMGFTNPGHVVVEGRVRASRISTAGRLPRRRFPGALRPTLDVPPVTFHAPPGVAVLWANPGEDGTVLGALLIGSRRKTASEGLIRDFRGLFNLSGVLLSGQI